jgi:hypothetical protein
MRVTRAILACFPPCVEAIICADLTLLTFRNFPQPSSKLPANDAYRILGKNSALKSIATTMADRHNQFRPTSNGYDGTGICPKIHVFTALCFRVPLRRAGRAATVRSAAERLRKRICSGQRAADATDGRRRRRRRFRGFLQLRPAERQLWCVFVSSES